MYYQLLGKPGRGSSPSYRGINRYGPMFDDSGAESSVHNAAFLRYIESEERIADLAEIRELAAIFRGAGWSLDLVRVDPAAEEPADPEPGTLGFDICQYGSHSLLNQGLDWDQRPCDSPTPAGTIQRLMAAYFRPRLNENGLFSEWPTARFFLDVVDALSALHPGTWEAVGYEQFEIVRLVLVEDAGGGAPQHTYSR